jgi:ABC-type multidrug transport system fused ATPase/permease subunit
MLSGGQRQRLAIARALYKESPVLILDDALSSVDARTEEQILNHLKKLPSFRIIIFVSHRISALKNADNILVMKKGQIVESGTHVELMEKNGYYSRLARLQQLTVEDEETWHEK